MSKKNNRAAPVFGLDFFDALPMPEGAESTVASQIEQWQADKQIPPKAVVTQSVTSKLDAINRNISGALAGTVDSLLRAPEAAGIALSGSKIPTGIIADAMKAIGTGVDVGNYHVAGLSDLADATSAKLQNYALNSDNVRAQKSAIADVEKKVLDGQVGALGDLTWDQVAGAVAGAVPSLALSAIAPELALITGGAQGAGGALKDARDYEKRTGQKLTDEQMAKSIAVSAAVNSIGEKIGVDAAMGKLGVNKLISDKLGAGIIARAANGVVGAVGEGGTEIAQTVGENYGKQIGYDANQRLSEGVLESALGGIGAGGAMGAIHRPTASQATNAREAATMPMTEIMDDVGMPSMHGQRYVQPIAPITPVNVDYAAAAATETALLAQQQAADLGESMAETPAPTATTEQQDTAQHSTAQYSTAQPSLTLEQAHTRRSAANKLIERLESSAENETALTAIQQSPVYQRAQNVLNTARQVIHEHEVQQQAQAKQDSAELAQRMTQRMTIDPYQGLSNQQQVIQDVNQSRIADALANYEADKQGDLGAQMANLRQLPQRMKIDPSMALSDQQQVINEVAAARKDGTLLPELKDSMADGRRKPTPHTMTIDPYQGYSDQQEAAFRAKAVADTTLQKQMADGREQLERKRDMSQKLKWENIPTSTDPIRTQVMNEMRGNSSAVPNSSAPSIDPTTGEVPNIQPAQSGVFNTPTPTLESQDVEVNKALTTETQSQALASNDIPDKQQPKKYNPRPDSSQDSALEFIAKHGGIDPSDQQANDLRVSIGAEPNKNVRIVGIRNLFAGKGKGMKLDAAAQLLWQHGYLDEHDSQALLNKLLDNGDYHGHEYDHAADYAAGQQEWSAQENESPVTTSADERKIVDAIVDSIDDDFFENIPFDLTSSHASAELEAWLNDDQGTNSQEAQRADASNETEAIGNDRARTTPPQNQTRENSEFTLSSETNAQILAREQAAQRQAEQARQRDSAPSADDFTLSGSKRDADVAAANGAQDLFDSTSTPTPPTNRTAGAITADGKAPLDQVLKMQGRTEFDASLEPVDEAQLSSLRNKNAAQHSTAQHSITQHNTTEFPASVGRQAKTAIPITPSEANTPEKIDDYGKKIGGAAKDNRFKFTKSLSDDLPADMVNVSLAKHFPEPNYQALIDSGTPIETLAAIKALRSIIEAKPRVTGKLKRWISTFTKIREMASELMTGELSIENLKRAADMVSQTREGAKLKGRIDLYAKLGYPAFMHAGKSSIVDAQFSVFEGQRGKIDKSVLTRPDGRTDYFDTNDQAFSALKQIIESTIKLSENNAKTGKETKLDVYKLRGSQGYIVGKKITSGKFIDLKGGFATAKEAFQHIEDHHGALVEQLEALKQRPSERRAINNDRIGVERRSGNVSAAQFAAAFGFDGRVEFGNSMPQDERQRNLNKAYDAFADLADVLNIPTESISLNGSLGMGFGSRGKGGIGAFAAHFEPDTLAINLTRNNGAGSLGHEWLHALDNYFSRMDGDKAGFISNNPRHPKLAGNAVRPEMRAAWKHVMAEIHASAMAKRSIVADSTRSKDYWSTDIEMVARAFERYLIQKSETKGITNDYLANIVEKDTWDFQEATGLDSYPYPTPEESARINEAFDSMFTALQVKEENGRKVLHSKSGKSRTAEFDALAWHERSTNQDGPVYKNDEFIIAASAHLADAHNGDFASDDGLPMGHAAYLHEDAQVYDFGIFDIDGRRVAEMTAQVDVFGDISAIHDIEVRKELRGSGMGAKIVKSIIANQPDGVQIIDMIPQAREFWRKLGVDYETTGSDSFIQNGTLTRDTYRGDDRGQSRALQSATPRRSFGARAPNGAGITSETSSGAQSSGQERLDSQHTIESIRADLVKANSATARLIQNGKLQIVQSVAELPADIRQSVDGETQAFYDPQTQQAYIVADGLQDDAYPVLLHELGHASKEEGGIFATQAKTLSKILDQASTTQALRDAVDERLADADLDPSHPDYAEERLMYAVEEAAQRNDIGSRTFIRRALDAMRAFYVKAALKFGLPTQLTEQDLYRLAEAELKRMAKAKTPSDNDPSGRSTEQHSAAQHSTAQRSTAQNSNTGILQSKAPNEAAHKVAQSLQSTGSLLASLKEMGADAFSLGLKAVPLHHLVEIYQDWMPSLKAMRRHTEQMFGRQNSLLAESDQMLVRMQKARKAFGQPDMDKLASVMHSATVWGIDPSKKSEASWTYEWRAAHGRLQAKYKTLPKELQQLFVDVRDHYNQRSEQVKDALIEQVDAALGATATAGRVIDKLRDEFDKRKEDGIYFPLARFGKYVITADGNQIVMRAETQTEADEVTAWLQQQGYADAKNNEESVRLDANRSVSPQFVKEMHDNITGKLGEDSPTAQAMLDELNQLFIEYLPNQSSRKNMIHRKNKAGYSNDIMRSFARTTSNMARDIANLEYSHQVGEALRDAEKEGRKLASTDEQREARKVINHLYELEKDELTHQDSSFVRKANGLGFLATMAWNLSSGLVNLSQAPILGFPMLATRFGDAATMREMMKSFTTTLKSGRFDAYLFDSTRGLDANSDEYKALKELETLGKRDMSAMMEIQNASSRASATLNSNADRWQRIVDAGSIFQRASELMNRDTIAIAGYRLARKGSNTVAPMSHSAAVDYLAKVLDETQFDYSRQNKAGMQRSNTGQFILLFKTYAINYFNLMGRQLNLSVRGGDKATRKAARGFMLRYGVMQMLATGAMGFPLWLPAGVAGGFAGQAVAKAAGTNQRTGTAIGATLGMALMTAFAAGLGADDDEPWDWNAELRSFCRQLAEKITGDQVVMGKGDDNHSAEVLMDLLSKGMPALLGWDVSGRIGANDLLWRNDDNPRLSNEQGFVGIMQSFLGSINIWGGKITRAVDQAGNGQYGKATEQLLPTAVANPIKAARQAIHGVTTGNGGKRPIEFGVYDFINQVAGLSPVAVRRELDYARDVNNRSVGLAIRQSDIKEAWANANQVTDPESRAAEKRDVIKMMQQFNQGKTIDRLSRRELDGYLKSRRRQQQTLDGTRRASRSQREAEASLDQ